MSGSHLTEVMGGGTFGLACLAVYFVAASIEEKFFSAPKRKAKTAAYYTAREAVAAEKVATAAAEAATRPRAQYACLGCNHEWAAPSGPVSCPSCGGHYVKGE